MNRSKLPLLFLASTLLAVATSCSGSGGSAAPTVTRPAQFEPSEPGVLAISPSGVFVEVGQTFRFAANLYDSIGLPQNAPTVEWRTDTPRIGSVASDGTFRGLAVGTAVLIAEDDGRRQATTIVEVVEPGAIPEGPVAVQFASPVLNLKIAQATAPTFVATDAHGVPAQPAPHIRLVSKSDRVSIDPTGVVTGSTEGLALVQPVLVGPGDSQTPLGGQLTVLVIDPDAPSHGSGDEYEVIGGEILAPPQVYSRPGLSSQLRALVYERKFPPPGPIRIDVWTVARIRQVAPTFVNIPHTDVVRVGATGLLESILPGVTTVEAGFERSDGLQISMSKFTVRVLPNLGGTWTLRAPNGDVGRLTMPEAAAVVVLRQDLLALDGTVIPNFYSPIMLSPVRMTGQSVLTNRDGQAACAGPARMSCGGVFIGGAADGLGTCSSERPGTLRTSSESLIEYCGLDRHPVRFGGLIEWTCIGPNTLRGNNDVELTRSAAPPPTGEMAVVEVDGRILQDSDPVAGREGGILTVAFFRDGNQDDFGVTFELDESMQQPGTYQLTTIGDLFSSVPNYLVYGRFNPLAAWSSSPTSPVTLTVEQVSADRLTATFQGTLTDIVNGGAPVTLSGGRVEVDIENPTPGSARFVVDGVEVVDQRPYAEWDGDRFGLIIEGGPSSGWSLWVNLSGVRGPGTYLSSDEPIGMGAQLSNQSIANGSFFTDINHVVGITITALDETHVVGSLQGSLIQASPSPSVATISGGRFEIDF